MKDLSQILEKEQKNPFSFYIITGDSKKNKDDVLFFLKDKLDFSKEKNQDFYSFKEISLSIATTREVKRINSVSKNDTKSLRVFFIDTKKIEDVSQNALLKTVEEPQDNTIFFLFLENTDLVLDTLKSRARIISGNEKISSKRAEDFMNSNYVEREKMIDKIIKKYENEKELKSQKIKDDLLDFFSEIEVVFLDKMNNESLSKDKILEISKFYKTFLDLKTQAKQNGSGIKNVFIYLAVFLPKI